MEDVDSAVKVWKSYTDTITDWETLIKGIDPKPTGCGPIYELQNPIDRPDESFAIADMRAIKITRASLSSKWGNRGIYCTARIRISCSWGQRTPYRKGFSYNNPARYNTFYNPFKRFGSGCYKFAVV